MVSFNGVSLFIRIVILIGLIQYFRFYIRKKVENVVGQKLQTNQIFIFISVSNVYFNPIDNADLKPPFKVTKDSWDSDRLVLELQILYIWVFLYVIMSVCLNIRFMTQSQGVFMNIFIDFPIFLPGWLSYTARLPWYDPIIWIIFKYHKGT